MLRAVLLSNGEKPTEMWAIEEWEGANSEAGFENVSVAINAILVLEMSDFVIYLLQLWALEAGKEKGL